MRRSPRSRASRSSSWRSELLPSSSEASQAALADETHHARLCFGLASAYLGSALGPSALSVSGALADVSIEEVVRTTVLEGCIGETQAALEAALALEACEDATVAAVLARIAEDETRHAALAFRFVAWALERRPELAAVVRETLSAHAENNAVTDTAMENVSQSPSRGARFGMLGEPERAACAREAWQRVIEPCAAELLRSVTPESHVGSAQIQRDVVPAVGRELENC